MENPFFNFIKPYLVYIDNGNFYRRPFSWFYMLIAILNLIFPIYILFKGFENEIFDAPTMYVVLYLLILVIITFASWVGFQIWWNRKFKVNSSSAEGDDFTATPVFSHFIQTFGEWAGTWVAIVGSSVALLATIILELILGMEARYFTHAIGVPFLETGPIFVILMPIYGFLIIVVSRFLAEQFRALSSIANNTSKR